jgi:hypothetical protein
MAIMPGGVEHGNDEHELLRLVDFVNDAIRKSVGRVASGLADGGCDEH